MDTAPARAGTDRPLPTPPGLRIGDPPGPAQPAATRVGLARALGAVSAGLGAAQVVAPHRVARLIGVESASHAVGAVRAVGLRELSVVPTLLLRTSPRGGLAARLAGDAVDLALLGKALRGGSSRGRTIAAAAAVAGMTAADVLAARGSLVSEVTVTATCTVNKTAEEAYALWRRLGDLPAFMPHVESVVENGNRSTWTAKAPGGLAMSWDAEIVEDVPGVVLSMAPVDESRALSAWCEVRFAPAPGGRGTEVRVLTRHRAPGAKLMARVGGAFGFSPRQQVEDSLRRYKQLLETGEIARSDGRLMGTSAVGQVTQRAAQPAGDGAGEQA